MREGLEEEVRALEDPCPDRVLCGTRVAPGFVFLFWQSPSSPAGSYCPQTNLIKVHTSKRYKVPICCLAALKHKYQPLLVVACLRCSRDKSVVCASDVMLSPHLFFLHGVIWKVVRILLMARYLVDCHLPITLCSSFFFGAQIALKKKKTNTKPLHMVHGLLKGIFNLLHSTLFGSLLKIRTP